MGGGGELRDAGPHRIAVGPTRVDRDRVRGAADADRRAGAQEVEAVDLEVRAQRRAHVRSHIQEGRHREAIRG